MSSRHPNDRDKSQEAVFRFLADPETQKLSEPVERVDTANAVVFLTGADVYKLKRAVKFPFMDLSRLDKRREACEAEIAVNRPVDRTCLMRPLRPPPNAAQRPAWRRRPASPLPASFSTRPWTGGLSASPPSDASDADAVVAHKQTADPLRQKGWAALPAFGSLSDTTALARARLRSA